MCRNRWLVLAASMVLVASCGGRDTGDPAAPALLDKMCLDPGDPERAVDVWYPPAGAVFACGFCTCVRWDVRGACGGWTATVEGWFDGEYRLLGGGLRNATELQWTTPQVACYRVRLRVTV